MHPIIKAIRYFPALSGYLSGVQDFNSRKYEKAKSNFEKCLKHPSFKNNKLALANYGQTLCALGQLEDGYGYLLKACEYFESSDWQLKELHELQVAKGTLSALQHISQHSDLVVPDQLLNKKLSDFPTK